jgi:excisionase family DNA binding protein
MGKILTVKEAAKYLNLNPQMVARKAQKGTLPAFKIDNRWRFRQEEIDRWITNRSNKGIREENFTDSVRSKGMKAIGYVRVSTQEQAMEGISLEVQEDKIRKYGRLHELNLIEVVKDEGNSGKDLNREGMQKVIALCEKRKVDHLIVYKMDRLTRNTLDLLILTERILKPNRVQFHSISERVDTSTTRGKFFLTLIGAMPQIGVVLGVIFCLMSWFFSTLGLGIIALLGKAKSDKKKDKISRGLCADCWLSGECDREKKAKKFGEIVTSCRGHLPKNKSTESS